MVRSNGEEIQQNPVRHQHCEIRYLKMMHCDVNVPCSCNAIGRPDFEDRGIVTVKYDVNVLKIEWTGRF